MDILSIIGNAIAGNWLVVSGSVILIIFSAANAKKMAGFVVDMVEKLPKPLRHPIKTALNNFGKGLDEKIPDKKK